MAGSSLEDSVFSCQLVLKVAEERGRSWFPKSDHRVLPSLRSWAPHLTVYEEVPGRHLSLGESGSPACRLPAFGEGPHPLQQHAMSCFHFVNASYTG